ncbi:MAG: transcriptional regulator [Gammaproteobacteria bacterium]|nr:transcriptional regulator [Gammaproteobacteria bacterium]
MLETALNIPATQKKQPATAVTRPSKIRAARYGYSFLLAATVVGWLLSDKELIRPEAGLGYWLGIIGGGLMLLLLLYPAGKKSSLLRRMGLLKHWFRIHMIFGLVGPLLVLYHCNFTVSAINSTVALYSMLAVAISGVIGRYFYTRIHRGLYGKRASVEDLRTEISDAMKNSSGLAAVLPKFINELHAVSARLIGEEYTRKISFRHSLSWTYRYYLVRLRLYLMINKELRQQASRSQALQKNSKSLRRTANRYATKQVGLMRQVAQLAFFERLFSLWHVFHMPLFLLLVVSALFHVLAVHMY